MSSAAQMNRKVGVKARPYQVDARGRRVSPMAIARDVREAFAAWDQRRLALVGRRRRGRPFKKDSA